MPPDTLQSAALIIDGTINEAQISSRDSTENGQYYFYKVVYKCAIGAVDSISIVMLGIYSGVSLPKIIKFS